MNTYTVEKTDTNGTSELETVQAKRMSVDMGCLQFYGPALGSPEGETLTKAYGIGGWINAEIKYP